MRDVPGYYYDGQTALRRNVRVDLLGQGLYLRSDDLPGGVVLWPLEDLRRVQDQPRDGSITLCRVQLDGDETQSWEERLVLREGDLAAWLRGHCPALDRGRVPRGTGRRVLTWIGGAAVALALMLFVILPGLAGLLARALPIEREVAYGKAVVSGVETFLGGRFASLTCDDPAGLAALDRMVAGLTRGRDTGYDISVAVFDHPMVNAFAAPGGQIVVLRGLIDESPDQATLAGVLAHEIAHVENRDPTRMMLRAAGSTGLVSLMLGDVTGGVLVAGLAEQMLNASYGREAERKADALGLEMLNAAGVDSRALAELFDQLFAGDDANTGLPGYLASHPQSAVRAEAVRANARGRVADRQLLSATEWRAVRHMCD